jgi:alkylation response protein AidB-like acyl-CoA dehydrogenase
MVCDLTRLAGLALVCLVALVVTSGCRRGAAPGAAAAGAGPLVVDVTAARATWVPVTRLLRVTGSLTADEEAEVAAETAGRVVDRAVQVHGAIGLVRGSTVERLYREARALRLREGTSEELRLELAEAILKEIR